MNRCLQKTALGLLALLAIPATCASELAAKPVSSMSRLAVVDSIVERAILDGQIPGAVVLIGHNGQVAYRKAFGRRAPGPRREAVKIGRGGGREEGEVLGGPGQLKKKRQSA